MTKRNYLSYVLLLFLSLGFTTTLLAQNTVQGTVESEDGTPLVGASVIIKGTTIGSLTDAEGKFSISTSQDFPFKVRVSYIGYSERDIEFTSASSMTISLEEKLLVDEVVISASRKREKIQEAPASISVVSARKLEISAQTADPVRNLQNVAGVQVQQQSANRINISMRGGAGLFGTSVFPILDYRSLVGPGIGTFQTDQSGLSNIDLQRIEVVRGPGSALYGPGVTQGVVHFITKSPIDVPGTTVELFGGELATFGGTIRHATKVSDKFGFKINAQYRQGDEFTLDPYDPVDATQIAKLIPNGGVFQPAVEERTGVVDPLSSGTLIKTLAELDEDGDGNPMANDWDNYSLNTTFEFRPKDDLNITLSGGFNSARAVFYNEQGEGCADNREFWGQARVQAGGLFAQVFAVNNDGGTMDNPTFLYQTGNRSPVGRTQFETQVQYNFQTLDFLNADWTAGVDYRFAGQDTEQLVYGRNEDDDSYSVLGGYLQGKFALASKLDLVLAGRYDRFNFIDDGAWAPRAALVYKVNRSHTFRASYNKASSTVSNLQLNIDFPLSVLVPGTADIWLYGNKTTQTFNDGSTAWMIPGVPTGLDQLPLAGAYSGVNDLVTAGFSGALAGTSLEPFTDAFIQALQPAAAGGAIDPLALGLTGQLSPGFNIFDNTPLGIIDAPISAISTTDNWEIGYKGLIADKLTLMVDVYRVVERNNSLFTAISPAYILNTTELGSDLANAMWVQAEPAFRAIMAGAGLAQADIDAAIAGLAPQFIGAYTAGGQGFADALGAFPFHAFTPTDQVPDNGVNHLSAGYRTFDERSYTGIDLGAEYYFTDDLSAFFNYSWINRNEFEQNVVGNEAAGPQPTFQNIPKNKYRLGINYTPGTGIRGSISFQHDDTYFSASGQFSGDTDERNLVDASLGYKFTNGLSIDATANNLFNYDYRYLPNMPRIGRRAMVRVVYTFGAQ